MKVIRKLSSWTGQFNNFWPFSFWQFSAAVLPHQEIFSVGCNKKDCTSTLASCWRSHSHWAWGLVTVFEGQECSERCQQKQKNLASSDSVQNHFVLLIFFILVVFWCWAFERRGRFHWKYYSGRGSPSTQVSEVWISKTASLSSGHGQTCKKINGTSQGLKWSHTKVMHLKWLNRVFIYYLQEF